MIYYVDRESMIVYINGMMAAEDILKNLIKIGGEDWKEWNVCTCSEESYYELNEHKYKIDPEETVNLANLFIKQHDN